MVGLYLLPKRSETESVYEMYYDFDEPIAKMAGHRTLALNRGEAEKILTVKVEVPEEQIIPYLQKKVITKDNAITRPVLEEVIEDSYKRLIAPAIEREIRSDLTEKGRRRSNRSVWKEPSAVINAAADRRTGCAWMGSCIPHRMQARCGRSDRKSVRYDCHLPDRATE